MHELKKNLWAEFVHFSNDERKICANLLFFGLVKVEMEQRLILEKIT